MTYIIFEGHRLDARTRDMIVTARRLTKVPLFITQGGYNNGAVAASAGTHDGGGALDIRALGLTAAQRSEAVRILRMVGFAAWLRNPDQGDWPWHIHCIALDCSEASAGAKKQMVAYRDHRNGLANNRTDDGLPLYVGGNWESFKIANPQLFTDRDVTIAKWSIQYGCKVLKDQKTSAMNPTDATYLDCAQFIAWALSQHITTDAQRQGWFDAVLRDKRYDYASAILTDIVLHTQIRFRLTVDGVFGPQTGAAMAQFGYKII